MTKRNVRSLDTIADNIHKLERGHIIDIGELLIEAKAQCKHGEWLGWLKAEFQWSEDSAERWMQVAELGSKFRAVRNLNVGVTVLYDLLEQDEDDLPAIVEELSRHATDKKLARHDAWRLITITVGRRHFGDFSDATLVKLVELETENKRDLWYEKAVSALQEQNPNTDGEADDLVINEIMKFEEEEDQEEASSPPSDINDDQNDDQCEAEALLDGPPPALPPPAALPQPQKLSAESDWAETQSFVNAVNRLKLQERELYEAAHELLELRAKPLARLVGVFAPAELREMASRMAELLEVADFLLTVAAAEKKESATATPAEADVPPASQVDVYPDLASELDRSLCGGTSAAAVAAGAKSTYVKLEGQEELSLDTSADTIEPANGGVLDWKVCVMGSEAGHHIACSDQTRYKVVPHPTHYTSEIFFADGNHAVVGRYRSLEAAKAAAEQHADEMSKAKGAPDEPSAEAGPSEGAEPIVGLPRERAKAVLRQTPSLTKREVMARANCASKCAQLAREELVKAGEIPANPRARKASAA